MSIEAGASDVVRTSQELERRLPEPLRPLGRIAYNYVWSWTLDGPSIFKDIDPYRWELFQGNPVRLLLDAPTTMLERAANDASVVARITELAARMDETLADAPHSATSPIAYFCAEFAIHRSLPIYSGGLGVLAGDFVKEASDRQVPLVGVGLFYRQGYFLQRLDLSGWQHEYWTDQDLERLPAVRVTRPDGTPLTVSVHVGERDVLAHIFRLNVGRSALFLLDTGLPENHPIDRWTTARLYESSRRIRLAQYAMLGIGGVRALEALGIEPGLIHMNEGHAALAALELARREVARGADFRTACARVRERVVFTTHTPVAAGNETYSAEELLAVFGDFAGRLGTSTDEFLGLGRCVPSHSYEQSGVTPLAIHMSRNVNAVSRRHGEVARSMWQSLYPGCTVDQVPITHVTNGVHLPTWMCPSMSRLFDRYLPPGWMAAAANPETWNAIESIPDDELWHARMFARSRLVDFVRARTVDDRLRRGEPIEYVEAAARTFNTDYLIVGFARRLATYKRLHLLTRNPARALSLLDGPRAVQLLLAGKAHPKDDEAKQIVRSMFALKSSPQVGNRVAFLENHDMEIEAMLVCGCDIWVNLPRPPQEASGTSGMKAAMNGVLNLSVLDGWWAEAYDGNNGWAIDGNIDSNEHAKDDRDSAALYDLLEKEIVPLYYEREGNLPRAWIRRMKAALRSLAPRYCASRMLADYERTVYASDRSELERVAYSSDGYAHE